jgi:hypothetical protein
MHPNICTLSSVYTLYSFASRKRALAILTILARIGDIGGKGSLTITPHKLSNGRTIYDLDFLFAEYALARAWLLNRPEVANEMLADTDGLYYKCALLSGMVQGLIYSRRK